MDAINKIFKEDLEELEQEKYRVVMMQQHLEKKPGNVTDEIIAAFDSHNTEKPIHQVKALKRSI